MDRDDGDAQGSFEWLDVGPAEAKPASPGTNRPRRWWYLLGVIVLAGAVLAAVQRQHTKPAASPSTHAPTVTRLEPEPEPGSTTPSTTAPISRPPTSPVSVTNVGHRLLDVPPDWELFARGTDVVVRIELARGRVTRTVVPALASDASVAFLAGSSQVIIRPFDSVPGYVVQDGRVPRDSSGLLQPGGPLLPGPDANHLWVLTGTGAQSEMALVGFDGRPTGVTLPVPGDQNGIAVNSDGAGYPLVTDIGGVYDVRPGGMHRITTGVLVASGPTGFLAVECDDQHRCATSVIDRATGSRRTIGARIDLSLSGSGVISPDGSTAALLRVDGSVHLLDLVSGVDHSARVSLDPDGAFLDNRFVWSPDSQWLFLAGPVGAVSIIDRHTMRATTLGVSLPPIQQLAFRSAH